MRHWGIISPCQKSSSFSPFPKIVWRQIASLTFFLPLSQPRREEIYSVHSEWGWAGLLARLHPNRRQSSAVKCDDNFTTFSSAADFFDWDKLTLWWKETFCNFVVILQCHPLKRARCFNFYFLQSNFTSFLMPSQWKNFDTENEIGCWHSPSVDPSPDKLI